MEKLLRCCISDLPLKVIEVSKEDDYLYAIAAISDSMLVNYPFSDK